MDRHAIQCPGALVRIEAEMSERHALERFITLKKDFETMGKKILKTLIAAALSAAMLTGCGGSADKKPVTVTEGILSVAFVDGEDRYTSSVSGAPEGIEADIARRAADSLGVSLQCTMADDLTMLFTGLQNGQYDLIFGRIPDTNPMLAGMSVSRSYGRGSLYLVTQKYDYMNSLTELSSGTVGVSVSAEALASKVPGLDALTRESYPNTETLAEAVRNGTVTVALVNEREAVEMISDNLQAQELFGGPVESYVAVMPASSPLADAVNGAIGSYYNDLIGIGPKQEQQ